MVRVTVRVELHKDEERNIVLDTDSPEYQTLHAEMRYRGFRRYVTNAADGEMQKLPSGEYSYEGTESAEQLYEKIKTAAYAAVGSHNRYAFILTRTTEGRKWYGLKKVGADPDA